jgi:hypothetical protein
MDEIQSLRVPVTNIVVHRKASSSPASEDCLGPQNFFSGGVQTCVHPHNPHAISTCTENISGKANVSSRQGGEISLMSQLGGQRRTHLNARQYCPEK